MDDQSQVQNVAITPVSRSPTPATCAAADRELTGSEAPALSPLEKDDSSICKPATENQRFARLPKPRQNRLAQFQLLVDSKLSH